MIHSEFILNLLRYCWRGLAGNGYIAGPVDEEGEFTGENIAYVYPDLKTAIVGTFKGGLLVRILLKSLTMKKRRFMKVECRTLSSCCLNSQLLQ